MMIEFSVNQDSEALGLTMDELSIVDSHKLTMARIIQPSMVPACVLDESAHTCQAIFHIIKFDYLNRWKLLLI